jgi:CBS domain-containing protein
VTAAFSGASSGGFQRIQKSKDRQQIYFAGLCIDSLDSGWAKFIMPESATSLQEALMQLLQLCDPEAAAVPIEASVADAIRKMLDYHVGAVGVVDREGRVAGIFTERDVLRRLSLTGLNPESTPVRDLMTTNVEMATEQTGPGEAMSTMIERHFRHLPVVDNSGKLLGILSIRNLLEWRIEGLTQELDSLEHYVSNDGPGG